MNKFTLTLLIFSTILVGCVENYEIKHTSISSLFGGVLEFETINDINTTNGRVNTYRISFKNKNLYNHYLIDKVAITNISAALMVKDNPDLFADIDYIEVKIIKENEAGSDSVYTAKYDSLNSTLIYKDYILKENRLYDFISYIKTNQIDSLKILSPNIFNDNQESEKLIEQINNHLPKQIQKINTAGYHRYLNTKGNEITETTLIVQDSSEHKLIRIKSINDISNLEIVGIKY